MLGHANRASLTAAIAVTIMLGARAGAEARAQAPAAPSPADTVVEALKKLSPADQEKAIKEAQGKLNLVHTKIFDPTLLDTVKDSLQFAITKDPGLSQQDLLTKAEAKFSEFLKLAEPSAGLSDADKSRIADLVSALAASNGPPAQREASPTPVPPEAQPPAPGGTTPPAGALARSFLQGSAISAGLEAFLLAKKADLITNHNHSQGVDPTPQELLTSLTAAIKKKPTVPTDGSFLSQFNKLTGQAVTDFTQLTSDDQDAVNALAARAAGTTAAAGPGAGAVTPSNPAGAGTGADSGARLTQDFIKGSILDQLQAFMLIKKAHIIDNHNHNLGTTVDPSPQVIQDSLKNSLSTRTTRPTDGTFLGEFNKLTGLKITDFSQLSDADKAAATSLASTVAGLPTPAGQRPQSPGSGQQDGDTSGLEQTVETALDDAGTAFVPGFAAFEPLANTLFQDLWSGLGRLRPFQRLHARRYMVLDDDGSLSAPASTSGTRYILVP